MKLKLLPALLFSLLILKLSGQQPNNINNVQPAGRGCGTGQLPQHFENWVQTITPVQNGKFNVNSVHSVFNIPVIVHLIHNNEAVNSVTANTGANLNAAQIIDQINILNKDCNGLNADTSLIPNVFKPVLGKFQFNFCLAVVNPTGGVLAEPGIDRINRVSKGWTAPPYTTTYISNTIKPNSIWDPNKYFNIWVCSISGGILGFATFPNPGGSGLGGLSPPYGSNTTDGVVILNSATGSIGTGSLGVYNKGRTATHEVGHWLGLRHIWGDANCGTDYCNDTPPAQTSNGGCPVHPYKLGTCPGNTTGEMTMNYMDYTYDACMYMFTNDQKNRAQLIMTNSPMRTTLLSSTVCSLPTATNDIGILYVSGPTYSQVINCNNFINPVVVISNPGSNTITSATFTYNVNGLNTQTLNWIGSLAPGATQTLNIPQYANLGNGAHVFHVGVYMPNGGIDSNPLNNFNNQVFSIVNSFTVNASATPSICPGATAALTATGSASGYTWMPGNLTGTSAIVSPAASTVYTLSAGIGTCVNTRTVSVNVGGSLSLSVTAPSSVCSGNSATISASGASTYTWSTGSNAASIVVSPAISTNYSLQASSGSCNAGTVVAISVSPNPTVNIIASPAGSICAGSSATLTATGASSYTWNTGSNANAIVVSPSVTTIYTVNGTSNTCAGSRTVSVVSGPSTVSLSISASSSSICSGNQATLTASGAASFLWSTGSNSASIVVGPAATTSYSVTGSTGACSSSSVLNIFVAPTPTLSHTVTPTGSICAGSSATINVAGAGSYSWTGGGSGSQIVVSPSVPTVYTITGTTGNCAANRTISVIAGANTISLTVNATSGTICSGNSTSLTVSGANTFTWNTGANSAGISVSPVATTIYTVTGTTGACSSTTTYTVGVVTTPTVNFLVAPAGSLCPGSSATITASGAGTYSWSSGGGGSSVVVTPLSNTVYTLSGYNGVCFQTVAVAVPVGSSSLNLQLNPASITVCIGYSAALTASGANSYTWSNGSNTPGITIFPLSASVFTVTGTNGPCTATASVQVSVVPPPTVAILGAPNGPICAGSSITLFASGAASFTWNTGFGGSMLTVTPAVSSIYSVNGSNAGCTVSQSIAVTIDQNTVALSLTANPASLCTGFSATLNVSGAPSYSWQAGSNLNTVVVTPSSTTIYTVTGSSGVCTATGQVLVTVVPAPPLLISSLPSDSICTGSSATLTASGDYTSFAWINPAVNGPVISVSPSSSTTYTVTGSANSCSNSVVKTIHVRPLPVTSVTVINPVCDIPCSGTVNAVSNTGIAPFTYSISGNTCTFLPCTNVCTGLQTLYTTDAAGCGSFNLFSVTCIETTGINEIIGISNGPSVFPNPASGQVFVSYEGDFGITLINQLGQICRLESGLSLTAAIDISGLIKGIYFLKVAAGGTVYTKKILIE